MATKCDSCPLRRAPLFVEMTSDEVRAMQSFKVGELIVDPGTPILMEGSNSPQLFTALSGMGIRYKLLQEGQRQVINFLFPGDFAGLQAGVMGEMEHSVEAVSKMTLCVFDRSELWRFFQANPERGFALTWMAAAEEHFLGDALATLGQRTAKQAVAWALLRVFQRGEKLGLTKSGAMRLPYKQQDLADALGLSLVHTNKTLKKLREDQVASWSEGVLKLSSPARLAKIALEEDHEIKPRPLF